MLLNPIRSDELDENRSSWTGLRQMQTGVVSRGCFCAQAQPPHELAKVKSIEAMMSYEILITPALVIEGEVAIKGRIPSERDLEALLKNVRT
jgi:hypothetical protein